MSDGNRPYYGPTLTPHQRESIAHYKRAAVSSLEHFGVTLETVNTYAYASSDVRRKAWLAESIFVALDALERGNFVLCLRCAFQVTNYEGRTGGWANPVMHDAFIFLRNALEDAMPGPRGWETEGHAHPPTNRPPGITCSEEYDLRDEGKDPRLCRISYHGGTPCDLLVGHLGECSGYRSERRP